MRKEIRIPLQEGGFGYYNLKEEYEEYFVLKKGGQGLFAEFTVKLIPNFSSEIVIEIEADAQEQLHTVQIGVVNAFERLDGICSKYDLGFLGFDATIKIGRFHVIDSKPIGYEIGIIQIMKRLTLEGFFEKKLLRYSPDNDLFQLTKIKEKTEYQYFEKNFSISLPILHQQLIELKNDWMAIICYGDHKEEDKKGVLAVKIETGRSISSQREIALKFSEDMPLSLTLSLTNQLQKIVKEIYKYGENLNSLKIEIGIGQLYDESLNKHFLIDSFTWMLKMLFLKEENIERKEERFYIKMLPSPK